MTASLLLHFGGENTHYAIMDFLLETGVEVDVPDERERRLLHLLAARGMTQAMKPF